MPAKEALKLLEQVLKHDEIEAFRHQQLNYSASLPLWVNSDELPPQPEPPDWLLEQIEDED